MNTASFDGNTPLHIASALNRLDMARLLMDCGADPHLENYDVVKIKTLDESGPLIYKAGFNSFMFARKNKQVRIRM